MQRVMSIAFCRAIDITLSATSKGALQQTAPPNVMWKLETVSGGDHRKPRFLWGYPKNFGRSGLGCIKIDFNSLMIVGMTLESA